VNKFKGSIIAFYILIVPLYCAASSGNLLLGARSAGMANASLTLTDLWSVHHNQAGLAELLKPVAGLSYENRFLVPELGSQGFAFAIPTLSGVLGTSVTRFGYKNYNETKIGLSFARKISTKASAGIQLNYHSTFIGDQHGQKGNVSFEAGARAEILPELFMGLHIFNPTRTRIAEYNDERMPTIIRVGFGYWYSEKVVVTLESEKDIDAENVVRAGLEYRVVKELFLRTGVSTNPLLTSFGIGLELNHFKVDLATSFHQKLGYSPQISLLHQFK
jgi:hypothetical protein